MRAGDTQPTLMDDAVWMQVASAPSGDASTLWVSPEGSHAGRLREVRIVAGRPWKYAGRSGAADRPVITGTRDDSLKSDQGRRRKAWEKREAYGFVGSLRT